jgi:acyl-CoA hydrolase
MKTYSTLRLVKSEDLNHHGTLYAARSAAWFVEAGVMAAAGTHGDTSEIVCRMIHGLSFTRPVQNGDVLRFDARIAAAGTTSLTTQIRVSSEITGRHAIDGYITFVVLDHTTGRPKPHHIVLDETADPEELASRDEAIRILTAAR